MFTSSRSTLMCDGVLFVERVQRVIVCSKVKYLRYGAEVKPSLNRANKLHVVDPKPGDLSMDRLKRE